MNSLDTRAGTLLCPVACALLAFSVAPAAAMEYLPGVEWPEPPVVTPADKPGAPPSDAIVLFDGTDFSAWNGADNWKVEDGVAVVGQGMIETKQHFADCQLHIEWATPSRVSGDGQGRGNSGVFFGPYELQILDSYENKTYFDGQAGAVYKQQPPQVNAMRPPGEWNTYEIIWTAPRFREDGSLESPAYITALHNGVLIQNHFAVRGNTYYNAPPIYWPHDSAQPIRLQDHGNPMRFRNIWVRELKPIRGKQVDPPAKKIGGEVKVIEEMQ